MTTCPCGTSLPYQQCCQPLHQGAPADTAEQLMRSRYSAFVLGLGEYLVHSWHPDSLGGIDAKTLSQNDTHWLFLEVLQSQGGPLDDHGIVEFKAWFNEKDQCQCLHERSRFIRYQGRWVYLDGQQPSPIKLGRNDLCHCGSAKKFKKCCG